MGKQRAVLAQIAAYHGKASVKAVLRGVFLRQRSGLRLKLHAGDAQERIFSAEQQRKAPASAAEIADGALRREPAKIGEEHGVCAQTELRLAPAHTKSAPKLFDHAAS